MPPTMQVGLICIVAGVLIAVFNPLGRVPAAGRGRRCKGLCRMAGLGTSRQPPHGGYRITLAVARRDRRAPDPAIQ
jgi:hypothetical protein